MGYLSSDIERLLRIKQQESLVRKHYSCGIFQEYDTNYTENNPARRES